MSLGPLYVLLGEVSIQDLCPFFNWIVCLPGMELYEFFIYFRDQTLVKDIIGNVYIFLNYKNNKLNKVLGRLSLIPADKCLCALRL